MGRLFVITRDSRFGYIKNTTLFSKFLKTRSKEDNLNLYRIFFNNHLLTSSTRYSFDKDYQKSFNKFWKRFSRKPIEIELGDEEIEYLSDAPQYPILDLKIYGKRVIVANREGLFEAKLQLDQKNTYLEKDFRRVFDAKSLSINPRLGELLVTTKSDGLFRGTLWDRKNIKVFKRPIIKDSIKNAWTKYSFINYEGPVTSTLFQNEIIDLQGNVPDFLREDRFGKPQRISNFAYDSLDLDERLESKIQKADIEFIFNSLSYLFIVNKSREIFFLKVDDADRRDYSQTSIGNFFRKLNIKVPRGAGRPLSGLTVHNGMLIEFFDRIYQFRKGHVNKIYSDKVIDTRAYPNSIRYKSLVQFTTEEGITFQSLFPYLPTKIVPDKT